MTNANDYCAECHNTGSYTPKRLYPATRYERERHEAGHDDTPDSVDCNCGRRPCNACGEASLALSADGACEVCAALTYEVHAVDRAGNDSVVYGGMTFGQACEAVAAAERDPYLQCNRYYVTNAAEQADDEGGPGLTAEQLEVSP